LGNTWAGEGSIGGFREKDEEKASSKTQLKSWGLLMPDKLSPVAQAFQPVQAQAKASWPPLATPEDEKM
jgi:hypothetical protein